MRARGYDCQYCGSRIIFRVGQVWRDRAVDARLRIVSPDRDGAIVEQVGRNERWSVSYRELVSSYVKEREA